jgi:hypothetical protein
VAEQQNAGDDCSWPGADFMKPFLSKFTCKTRIGSNLSL